MIKSKLLKSILLGLCMSALSTGIAFASSGEGSAAASAGQVTGAATDAATNALFEKQREIDQYVFKDHVQDIEEKGFAITYTGITDTNVEIGITPFDDSNAQYLYDIFGSEGVKVVASEEAMLYTTEVAPDKSVTSEVAEQPADDQIYTTMELSPNTTAAGTDAVDPTLEDKVYKEDQDVKIQIESTEVTEAPMDPSVIYQTGVTDAGQENQVVYATDDKAAVAEGSVVSDDSSKGLSTPTIILIIAGGAVLIGGAVILSGKKKAVK